MVEGRCRPGDNKSCAAAKLVLCILQNDAEARGGGTEGGRAT
jgi:hypothetical protein